MNAYESTSDEITLKATLPNGKGGNRVKALFWDRNGLVIFYK